MITFEAFKAQANEINQAGLGDTHAIGVDQSKPGKLGQYKVTAEPMSEAERAKFQAVKAELTAALSSEFGVKDVTSLPKAIQDVLGVVTENERLMATDISKLADVIREVKAAREVALEEFCQRSDKVGATITAALKRCLGEETTVTLPAQSPLGRALSLAFEDALKEMESVASVEALKLSQQALADGLEAKLQKIVDDAFGTSEQPGPLAQQLAAATKGLDVGGDLWNGAATKVLNAYLPEGMSATETEAEELKLTGVAEPAVDPASTKLADRVQEMNRLLAVFNDRLSELVGDHQRNDGDHVSTGIPKGGKLAAKLDQIIDKNHPKTVAAVREEMQQLIETTLGTKSKPTALAKQLMEIGKNGETIGTKRLQMRQAMMLEGVGKDDELGKRLACISVCRLAMSDFEVCRNRNAELEKAFGDDDDFVPDADDLEALAMDPENKRRIGWILNHRSDDLKVLTTLTDFVLKGDTENIAQLDRDLGDPFRTPAEIDLMFSNHDCQVLENIVYAHHSVYANDPNFLLYLQQCTGEQPVDMVDGQAVYKVGNWSRNSLYCEEMLRLSQFLPGDISTSYDPSDPRLSAEGVRDRADDCRIKSVEDFRRAFNLRKDGSFATNPARTKGQLYLDKHGALKSANRHFGSSVPSTPEENHWLRLSLLDAFRSGGADQAFLAKARQLLELGTEGQVKPLSRQVVKALIIDFDALGNKVIQNRTAKPKAEPKTVSAPKDEIRIEIRPDAQLEPEVPQHVTAPRDIDIDHPTEYANLWRQPMGIVKRTLAFIRNVPNAGLLSGLNPDGGPFDWLNSLASSRGRDMFAIRLSNVLKDLPELAGAEPDAKLVENCFRDAVADAQKLYTDSQEVRLTAIARHLADRLMGHGGKGASTIQVDLVKFALMKAVASLRSLRDVNFNIDRTIIAQGGGLVHADGWEFRENGTTYRSQLTPRTDIETKMKVQNDFDKHLTGLSRSELTNVDGSQSLMTFLRFGEVVNNGRSLNTRLDGLKELAMHTFLNNPKLVAAAKNGDSIDLPIVRTDLGGNEFFHDTTESFQLTFTPPNGVPTTVTINPKVEHFCLPTDSVKSNWVGPERWQKIQGQPPLVMDESEVQWNRQAWASLKNRAEQYQGENRAAVQLLVQQIDDYFRLLLPQDAKTVKPFPNFGAELTRLGGRIGVLAALIGDVPSVNCNWGRDRTGVMDNEFKLTMVTVLKDPNALPSIRLAPGKTDPLTAQRTRMLDSTGNRQIAGQVNCTAHDISLHQFEAVNKEGVQYEGGTLKTSGLSTLFHVEALPKFSLHQTEGAETVPLYDDQGKAKSKETLCNELLKVKNARVIENVGNGHCFFYSAIAQLKDNELGGKVMKVAELRSQLARRVKTAKSLYETGNAKGIVVRGGELYVKTSKGEVHVQEAYKAVTGENGDSFVNGNDNADVAHGAFLADMLKRPVIVIAADTGKSGATMTTFDCDLTTGEKFANTEPVIMYYNRINNSGHFRAVEVQ